MRNTMKLVYIETAKNWTKEEFEHDFFLKTTEAPSEIDNPFFTVMGEKNEAI